MSAQPPKYKVTKQALVDFVATVDANPSMGVKEIYGKFPELNNDPNALKSFVDWRATVKSGKYKTLEEVVPKFPEFELVDEMPAPKVVAKEGVSLDDLSEKANNVATDLGDRVGDVTVVVTSTKRSKEENEAVGGVPDSYHLTGDAVDLRPSKELDKFLTSEEGVKWADEKGYKVIDERGKKDSAHWHLQPKEEAAPVTGKIPDFLKPSEPTQIIEPSESKTVAVKKIPAPVDRDTRAMSYAKILADSFAGTAVIDLVKSGGAAADYLNEQFGKIHPMLGSSDPMKESYLTKIGRGLDDLLTDAIDMEEIPQEHKEEIGGQLAAGVGQILGFITPMGWSGAASKAVIKHGTTALVKKTLGNKVKQETVEKIAEKMGKGLSEAVTPSGVIKGGSMTAVSEYEAAIESGMGKEEAFEQVFAPNFLVGQTEMIPVNLALGRLNKLTKGAAGDYLIDMVKGGASEGLQEGLQGWLANQIAQGTYDPDRGWDENVLEGAGVGTILGMLIPGVGGIPKVASGVRTKNAVESKATVVVAPPISGEINISKNPVSTPSKTVSLYSTGLKDEKGQPVYIREVKTKKATIYTSQDGTITRASAMAVAEAIQDKSIPAPTLGQIKKADEYIEAEGYNKAAFAEAYHKELGYPMSKAKREADKDLVLFNTTLGNNEKLSKAEALAMVRSGEAQKLINESPAGPVKAEEAKPKKAAKPAKEKPAKEKPTAEVKPEVAKTTKAAAVVKPEATKKVKPAVAKPAPVVKPEAVKEVKPAATKAAAVVKPKAEKVIQPAKPAEKAKAVVKPETEKVVKPEVKPKVEVKEEKEVKPDASKLKKVVATVEDEDLDIGSNIGHKDEAIRRRGKTEFRKKTGLNWDTDRWKMTPAQIRYWDSAVRGDKDVVAIDPESAPVKPDKPKEAAKKTAPAKTAPSKKDQPAWRTKYEKTSDKELADMYTKATKAAVISPALKPFADEIGKEILNRKNEGKPAVSKPAAPAKKAAVKPEGEKKKSDKWRSKYKTYPTNELRDLLKSASKSDSDKETVAEILEELRIRKENKTARVMTAKKEARQEKEEEQKEEVKPEVPTKESKYKKYSTDELSDLFSTMSANDPDLDEVSKELGVRQEKEELVPFWVKIEKAKTLKEALQVIANRKSFPLSGLAKWLLENGDADGLNVRMNDPDLKLSPGTGGGYWVDQDTINIRSGIGNTDYVLLHEAMHAFTVKKIKSIFGKKYEWALQDSDEQLQAYLKDGDNESLKTLIEIYNTAPSYGLDDIEYHYGMSNFGEFIAELFVNKEFQEGLNKIPFKGTNKSVLQTIFDAIQKILGVPVTHGNALDVAIREATGLVTGKRSDFVKPKPVKAPKEVKPEPVAAKEEIKPEVKPKGKSTAVDENRPYTVDNVEWNEGALGGVHIKGLSLKYGYFLRFDGKYSVANSGMVSKKYYKTEAEAKQRVVDLHNGDFNKEFSDKIGEANTVRDILVLIAGLKKTHKYSPIAKALLRVLPKSVYNTKVVKGDFHPNYETTEDAISISDNHPASEFIHEIIHAATANKIIESIPFSRNDFSYDTKNAPEDLRPLLDLFNKIKSKYREEARKKSIYGLTNIHEFLAESFSSENFAEWLQSKPSMKSTKATLWDDVKDAFRKLIGMPVDQRTLFDDVMETNFSYIESTSKNDEVKPEPVVEEKKEEPVAVEQYEPVDRKKLRHNKFTKDEASDYEEDTKETDSGREVTYLSSISVAVEDIDGNTIGTLIKLKDEDGTISWQAEDSEGGMISEDPFDEKGQAMEAIADEWDKIQKKEFDRETKKQQKQQEKEAKKEKPLSPKADTKKKQQLVSDFEKLVNPTEASEKVSQESQDVLDYFSKDIFPATVGDAVELMGDLSGYSGQMGAAKAVARLKQMETEGLIKIEGKKIIPTFELLDTDYVPASMPVILEANKAANDSEKIPVVASEIHVAGFGYDQFQLLRGKAAHIFKKYFTSKGYLPKRVFDAWNKTKAEVLGYQYDVENTVKDLKKAIKEEYGIPTTDQVKEFNSYLAGDKSISVKPETKKVLDHMRSQIKNLSSLLISDGIVSGELEAKILKNQSTYLSRSYQKWDDPKWADRVPEEVKNNAMAFLREKYSGPNRRKNQPKLKQHELDGLMKFILTDSRSPMMIFKGESLGRVNLSALRERKDIDVSIRMLMGEYQDPIINYARTITRVADLLEKQKFQAQMKDSGTFYDKPVVIDGVDYDTKLAPFASEYSPLKDLYTTKEIAEVFNNLNSVQPAPSWLAVIRKANAAVNYSLTVLSPTTHSRNFLSNFGFQLINWNINPKNAKKLGEYWLGVDKKDLRKRYMKLGILNESVTVGIFNSYIEQIRDGVSQYNEKLRVSEGGTKIFKEKVTKAAKNVRQAYFEGDNVHKIFAFESEAAKYRKAYPHWSQSDVDRAAAEVVNRTMPNYSRIPRAIRGIQDVPLIGGFISFPSEVVRNTVNTLQLAYEEIGSGNAELRKAGIGRLSGIALNIIALSTASSVSRAMFGMNDDDDDALRYFVGPWAKNNQFIIVGRGIDSKGNKYYEYLDLGPLDPHSSLKGIYHAFMRGNREGIDEAIANSVIQMATPFMNEQAATRTLIDLRRNQNQFGRPIYDVMASPEEKFEAMSEHVYKGSAPGFAKLIADWRKTGEVDPYGKEYTIKGHIGRAIGIKVERRNIDQAMGFKQAEILNQIKTTKSFVNKKITVTTTPEEKKEIINEYKNTMANIKREYDAIRAAYVRLGGKKNDKSFIDVISAPFAF